MEIDPFYGDCERCKNPIVDDYDYMTTNKGEDVYYACFDWEKDFDRGELK